MRQNKTPIAPHVAAAVAQIVESGNPPLEAAFIAQIGATQYALGVQAGTRVIPNPIAAPAPAAAEPLV